jgi:hypothetical protein
MGRSEMNEPVISGDRLFVADDSGKSGPVVREMGTSEKVYWEIEADGSGDLIRAGNHLYAAGKKALSAIELPAKRGWQTETELDAAGGGRDSAFAGGERQAGGGDAGRTHPGVWRGPKGGLGALRETQPLPTAPAEAMAQAAALLEKVEDKGGHALVFGTDETGLVYALLASSKMLITVIEPAADKVAALRELYDACGVLWQADHGAGG